MADWEDLAGWVAKESLGVEEELLTAVASMELEGVLEGMALGVLVPVEGGEGKGALKVVGWVGWVGLAARAEVAEEEALGVEKEVVAKEVGRGLEGGLVVLGSLGLMV